MTNTDALTPTRPSHRPACDDCRLQRLDPLPALFDVLVPGRRQWRYLCLDHFIAAGAQLGAGVGVRL